MTSNGSDSSSNGSISVQKDEIARQLVEAVSQCQDAPAVAGQQARAQAEIKAIEALLDPVVEIAKNLFSSHYSFSGGDKYLRHKDALEDPIEFAAVFAKETKNRALAKAARQVRGALVAIDQAVRYGDEHTKKKNSYRDQWYEENRREANEAEKAILKPLLERQQQAELEAESLIQGVKDRLQQLRAQAQVDLGLAQTRASEIDQWEKRLTELQAVAHALAAVRRVPDAPEDEGPHDR